MPKKLTVCIKIPQEVCESYESKIATAAAEIQRLQKDCIDYAELLDAIEAIDNEHPYRIVGHYDTYSDYNQGWADACARIEEMLEAKMKSRRSEGTDPNEEVLPGAE